MFYIGYQQTRGRSCHTRDLLRVPTDVTRSPDLLVRWAAPFVMGWPTMMADPNPACVPWLYYGRWGDGRPSIQIRDVFN